MQQVHDCFDALIAENDNNFASLEMHLGSLGYHLTRKFSASMVAAG